MPDLEETQKYLQGHMDVQEPEKYTEAEYKQFEAKLNDPNTNIEEIERIAMTLAHIPDERALQMLKRFKENPRSAEVRWGIETAIDECTFWVLSPRGEQEERDFLAMKLIHDYDERQVELGVEMEKKQEAVRKLEIELEVVERPAKRRPNFRERTVTLRDLLAMEQARLTKLQEELDQNEFILQALEKSIKTERFLKYGRWVIGSHMH